MIQRNRLIIGLVLALALVIALFVYSPKGARARLVKAASRAISSAKSFASDALDAALKLASESNAGAGEQQHHEEEERKEPTFKLSQPLRMQQAPLGTKLDGATQVGANAGAEGAKSAPAAPEKKVAAAPEPAQANHEFTTEELLDSKIRYLRSAVVTASCSAFRRNMASLASSARRACVESSKRNAESHKNIAECDALYLNSVKSSIARYVKNRADAASAKKSSPMAALQKPSLGDSIDLSGAVNPAEAAARARSMCTDPVRNTFAEVLGWSSPRIMKEFFKARNSTYVESGGPRGALLRTLEEASADSDRYDFHDEEEDYGSDALEFSFAVARCMHILEESVASQR